MKLRALASCVLAVSLVAPARAQLTAVDVQRIITQATSRATAVSPNSVIAVTDREGDVLGVWNVRGGQPTAIEISSCVSKAGTAAYLSSNQNAFTSRTAGYIIQDHFPPGVRNTAPGPLVGVGLSNLFFSDINKFRKPGSVISFSGQPGLTILPVIGTSLDGSPGGVPLYKNGALVGAVGVTGDGVPGPIPGLRSQNPFQFIPGYDKDEDVALSGQRGYAPVSSILATHVFINGISLPYVNSSTVFPTTQALRGNVVTGYPIQNTPAPFAYPVAVFGGVSGQIRQPIRNDPLTTPINGRARLTAAEVTRIINFAANRARITRAGIRLPIGQAARVFITVVNNPNSPAIVPAVLGTFRTGEATLFSWDVAVQKARTAIFFSSNTLAMSPRTVGFLGVDHYPPGLDVQAPGPYFGLQEQFSGFVRSALPLVVPNPAFAPDPRLRNGVTIFPGGFPLYRNGQIIGAVGVSGDGVDQDDIIGASGTNDFPAPFAIRADQFGYLGVRLPYAKFPRDPPL
ncbi:MAG: heme-binding protein [Verrucomicrobiota bacterium]